MGDRWQRLQEILVDSWQLPAAEREAFWSEHAAGDPGLLSELRELSAAREAADRWTPAAAASSEPLRRIGPYLLDRLIGRGGMGAVYLAHRADGEYERQVALKVIGLPLELESFRERFRRERQILAGLSHPNIAHLLDGGTTEEGELYLAMEYVDGVAIDRYAGGLPVADRLRLFRAVCDGVQYAHQHLVVHRDIKPANILVNAEGIPKLLDFGAAKLLAGAENTATQFQWITAAYASPEQLRGEPASTLSDVFSLGALLFELAAGARAFDTDLVSRVAGFARASAVPLPATLPGDLDRVVRKALALDPAQRYPSVEQLSEDVRRYQAAEPVLAHSPGVAYRARKFVRRHAASVALAAVFAFGLAGATVFSLREARLAQKQADRAQASNQFLTTLFQVPFVDTASRHDMTVKELLELAGQRVSAVLGQDPASATDADFVLGAGLESQEAHAEARALFERALERSRQAGDLPRQSAAMSWLALVSYQTGDAPRAWTQALEALALWKRSPRSFTPQQAVFVLGQSGQTLQYIRPTDLVHREYLEEAVRLARKYPKVETLWRAHAFHALAESYLGAPGDAQQSYRAAYPLIQEALALDRSDPSLGIGLIESLQSWGRVNRFLGHYDQDEAAQREVYQLMVQMLGADNAATASQRGVWAVSLVGIGKAEGAWPQAREALAAMRLKFPVPGSFQLWTNTAAAAYAACLTGRFQPCETLAREALQTLGPDPQPTDFRLYEARSYLGMALSGQGRYTEALPLLEPTLAFYRSRNRQGVFRTALEEAYGKAKQATR